MRHRLPHGGLQRRLLQAVGPEEPPRPVHDDPDAEPRGPVDRDVLGLAVLDVDVLAAVLADADVSVRRPRLPHQLAGSIQQRLSRCAPFIRDSNRTSLVGCHWLLAASAVRKNTGGQAASGTRSVRVR